jgi:hypothetical protein
MTQRGSENPLFSLWEAGPINEARRLKWACLHWTIGEDAWVGVAPGAEPSNDVEIPMLLQPVLVGFDGERAPASSSSRHWGKWARHEFGL